MHTYLIRYSTTRAQRYTHTCTHTHGHTSDKWAHLRLCYRLTIYSFTIDIMLQCWQSAACRQGRYGKQTRASDQRQQSP